MNQTGNAGKNETKPMEENFASHYALQVALQTMKERCQLLQQRLSSVEEENLRFRIESQNNLRRCSDTIPRTEICKLEERITQLTRQKSQLNDRMAMVTKENNQLWTRLSRLTEANQSLGNHLSKISDTLSKHSVGEPSKLNDSTDVIDCSSDIQKQPSETREESLEEISLKILDGIRREKEDLEQQCEEMIELQTGAVSVEQCGFTLTADGDIGNGVIKEDGMMDEEEVMVDMSTLREKMKEQHKLLKDQQTALSAAITSFNAYVNSGGKCCHCGGLITKNDNKPNALNTTELEGVSTMKYPFHDMKRPLNDEAERPVNAEDMPPVLPTNIPFDLTDRTGRSDCNTTQFNGNDDAYVNNLDRICPLCSKCYTRKVPFDEFHEHVLSHFTAEDEENNSFLANFESTPDYPW